MTGNEQVVGYNQISRFTLTADGTAVVPGSERVILRVPKAKISGSPAGFTGGPTDSGPGHVGGAGLDFDSAGNLYLGVGDDVSPNAQRSRRLRADGLPRQGALGRAQDLPELRGPARQDRPHHAEAGRHRGRRGAGRGHDVRRPGGQPVPGRHGEDPSRDLRDGLPPAVHAAHRPGQPGHRGHGRVLPRQPAPMPAQPLAGGHVRVEPAQQAGQPRLAVLRR